jgi:TonB-dependent SusC/RagA subfamily outer membrane receptor
MTEATSVVSGEVLQKHPITVLQNAFTSTVNGVQTYEWSSEPGWTETAMYIRGIRTMNKSARSPLVIVDNVERDLSFLDAFPIENITILKDAAATAIWGSQGANGVISIKTKRGSRGPTIVDYSYGLNVTYQPDGIRMLNGDDYTMFMKEAYFNPELNDAAANLRELNYDPMFSEYHMFNNNTDWVDAVKQVGMRHSHFLSLAGGGEKANFRVSGGYDNETGSIIAQSLQRFSTRVNLDYWVSERI